MCLKSLYILIPFSVVIVCAGFIFECRTKFTVASAFYTHSGNKAVTVFTVFKPLFIHFRAYFQRTVNRFKVTLYTFKRSSLACFKQKTFFTYMFHYSITNFTTLQGGILAVNPPAFNLKSLNSFS